MAETLSSNQIVKIRLKGLCYTKDGFVTVSLGINKKAIHVYEFIDLVTYPSCNDFHGAKSLVVEDQLAVVIKHVGRPVNVSRDPVWFMYDVYDVLVDGKIRQMFQQNLIPVLTELSQ